MDRKRNHRYSLRAKGKQEEDHVETGDEFEDEVDVFHANKEKVLRSHYLDPASSTDDDLLSDEEVLGLGDSSSKEDFQDEESNTEDMDAPKDYVINDKSWGHSKKAFYNADIDLLSETGSIGDAELEEAEATKLQQRLLQDLSEADFAIEDRLEQYKQGKQIQVSQDLSKLSLQAKLSLLRKTGPELFELIEDFQHYFRAILEQIWPQMMSAQEHKADEWEFLNVSLHLYLCYCVNIMFYLHLKLTKSSSVSTHPVIARILHIRQLISEWAHVETIGTAAEVYLDKSSHVQMLLEEAHVPPKDKAQALPQDMSALEYYEQLKQSASAKKHTHRTQELEHQFEENVLVDGSKRAITYQIARNKGLTPKRRKDQRNPRVKHRNKYQKALIKRKSQVLPVVTELVKYGGEASGIRSNLSRSIKLK